MIMTHYVLSIDVKRVDTGEPGRVRVGSVSAPTEAKREITDELHIVRKTDTLPVAVEYAIHVLTMERNQGVQAQDADEQAWDKAAELFPMVRQAIYNAGGRGVTSTGLDEAACLVIRVATGVSLAVENGKVVR
jgi:hypothetical protein